MIGLAILLAAIVYGVCCTLVGWWMANARRGAMIIRESQSGGAPWAQAWPRCNADIPPQELWQLPGGTDPYRDRLP